LPQRQLAEARMLNGGERVALGGGANLASGL